MPHFCSIFNLTDNKHHLYIFSSVLSKGLSDRLVLGNGNILNFYLPSRAAMANLGVPDTQRKVQSRIFPSFSLSVFESLWQNCRTSTHRFLTQTFTAWVKCSHFHPHFKAKSAFLPCWSSNLLMNLYYSDSIKSETHFLCYFSLECKMLPSWECEAGNELSFAWEESIFDTQKTSSLAWRCYYVYQNEKCS